MDPVCHWTVKGSQFSTVLLKRSAPSSNASSIQCSAAQCSADTRQHKVGDAVKFSRDDYGETEDVESLQREEAEILLFFQAIVIRKLK